MLKSIVHIAALALLTVLMVGCSDAGDDTTTSLDPAAGAAGAEAASAEDVVFGSGEMPETLPNTFPVPQGSVIGSTMVVTKTGFTEIVLRINADVDLSVQFFEQGLVQAGFNVDSSAADDNYGWLIEYSDSSAKGRIRFTESIEGITQAVVRHNVP